MFIVVREWGEYSDHGSRCAFACETEAEALLGVELMKKIDAYNKERSKKYQQDIEEFKKTLDYKPYPPVLRKNVVDPFNLIPQKEWISKNMKAHGEIVSEFHKHNDALEVQVENFKRLYPREIPEEFKGFEGDIVLNEYSCYDDYHYSVEEIKVLKF
jgi:hypothetical protein